MDGQDPPHYRRGPRPPPPAGVFAEQLGTVDLDTRLLRAPTDLDRTEYTQILAVHMAALATVDSFMRGQQTPLDLISISDYLLCREYAAWDLLHGHRKNFTRSPVMNRLAYVATLVGALPRPHARTALQRTQLAENAVGADHLLDDHLACYPSVEPTTVIEPIRPDRLGEDPIALTTLGHSHRNLNWQLDDWTVAAASDEHDSSRMLTAPEVLVTAGPLDSPTSEGGARKPRTSLRLLVRIVQVKRSITLDRRSASRT